MQSHSAVRNNNSRTSCSDNISSGVVKQRLSPVLFLFQYIHTLYCFQQVCYRFAHTYVNNSSKDFLRPNKTKVGNVICTNEVHLPAKVTPPMVFILLCPPMVFILLCGQEPTHSYSHEFHTGSTCSFVCSQHSYSQKSTNPCVLQ